MYERMGGGGGGLGVPAGFFHFCANPLPQGQGKFQQ